MNIVVDKYKNIARGRIIAIPLNIFASVKGDFQAIDLDDFSGDNEDMVLCVCIPAFYLCVFVCISV